MKYSCKDIKIIKSQKIRNENLVIYNEVDKEIFKIKRFFSINENKGAIRGKHAHIQCKQFLICSLGKIKIICKDGKNKKTFLLSNSSSGLLIPEGIWSTQFYLSEKNILNVFCNQDFSENDYIRNYDSFLKLYQNK